MTADEVEALLAESERAELAIQQNEIEFWESFYAARAAEVDGGSA